MKVLTLRIPQKLDRKLSAMAKGRSTRKTIVARQALERYLAEIRDIRKEGSFLDLAGSLVGCVKDAPADLSSNPKHVDGYDSQHGVWHRHHLGEVSPVETTSFEEIEARFEAEIGPYIRGRRQ